MIFIPLAGAFLAASGDARAVFGGCAAKPPAIPKTRENSGENIKNFELTFPDADTGRPVWLILGASASNPDKTRTTFMVEEPELKRFGYDKTGILDSVVSTVSRRGILVNMQENSSVSFQEDVLVKYFTVEGGKEVQAGSMAGRNLQIVMNKKARGAAEREGTAWSSAAVLLESRDLSVGAGGGFIGPINMDNVMFYPPVEAVVRMKSYPRLMGQKKRKAEPGPIKFSAQGGLTIDNGFYLGGKQHQRITLENHVTAVQDEYTIAADRMDIYIDPEVAAGPSADRFELLDAAGGVKLRRGPLEFAAANAARGTRLSAEGRESFDLVLRGAPQAELRDNRSDILADTITFRDRVELENTQYAYLAGDVKAAIEGGIPGGGQSDRWTIFADAVRAEIDWVEFERLQREKKIASPDSSLTREQISFIRNLKTEGESGKSIFLRYGGRGTRYDIEGKSLEIRGTPGIITVLGNSSFMPCIRTSDYHFIEGRRVEMELDKRTIRFTENVRMTVFPPENASDARKNRFWEITADEIVLKWEEVVEPKDIKPRRLTSEIVAGAKTGTVELRETPAPGALGASRILTARVIRWNPKTEVAEASSPPGFPKPRLSEGADWIEGKIISLSRARNMAHFSGNVSAVYTPRPQNAADDASPAAGDFYSPWAMKSQSMTAFFRGSPAGGRLSMDNAVLEGGVVVENKNACVIMRSEKAEIDADNSTVFLTGVDTRPLIEYGESVKSDATARKIWLDGKPISDSGAVRMFLSGDANANLNSIDRKTKELRRWSVKSEDMILYYRMKDHTLLGMRLAGSVAFDDAGEGPTKGMKLRGNEGYYDAENRILTVTGDARGEMGATKWSEAQIVVDYAKGDVYTYSMDKKRTWQVDPAGMEIMKNQNSKRGQ